MRSDVLLGLNDAPLGEAAQTYLDAGLLVFPCRAGAKHPATRRGFKSALRLPRAAVAAREDLRTKTGTFFTDGGYNIGLPTGVDVDVLDVDVRGGKPGLRTLRTLQDAGLLAGAVATAQTPSGGWHIYFPAAGEKSRALPSAGLDWKAQGGYVLAAPSVIIEYGDLGITMPTYRWSWGRPLDEGTPLTWERITKALGVPASLTRTRNHVPDPSMHPEDVVTQMAHWLSGQDQDRNRALYWASCRCVDAGTSDPEQLRPLFEASASLQTASDGPERLAEPDGELWRTIQSAFRGESR